MNPMVSPEQFHNDVDRFIRANEPFAAIQVTDQDMIKQRFRGLFEEAKRVQIPPEKQKAVYRDKIELIRAYNSFERQVNKNTQQATASFSFLNRIARSVSSFFSSIKHFFVIWVLPIDYTSVDKNVNDLFNKIAPPALTPSPSQPTPPPPRQPSPSPQPHEPSPPPRQPSPSPQLHEPPPQPHEPPPQPHEPSPQPHEPSPHPHEPSPQPHEPSPQPHEPPPQPHEPSPQPHEPSPPPYEPSQFSEVVSEGSSSPIPKPLEEYPLIESDIFVPPTSEEERKNKALTQFNELTARYDHIIHNAEIAIQGSLWEQIQPLENAIMDLAQNRQQVVSANEAFDLEHKYRNIFNARDAELRRLVAELNDKFIQSTAIASGSRQNFQPGMFRVLGPTAPAFLQNHENSCWRNSVYQVMFNSEQMVRFIQNRYRNSASFNENEKRSLELLYQLLQSYRAIPHDVNASNFARYQAAIEQFERCDVEFYRSLRNALRLSDAPNATQETEDGSDYLYKILQILKFSIPMEVTNQVAIEGNIVTLDSRSDVYNGFLNFYLPQPGLPEQPRNLDGLLRSEFGTRLTNSEMGNEYSTSKIADLPDLIPFMINRSGQQVAIDMPIEVDLRDYISETVLNQGNVSTKYRLKGFVFLGDEHYRSVTFKDGKWYHCDDARAEAYYEITNEDDFNFLKSNSYVYFYERV